MHLVETKTSKLGFASHNKAESGREPAEVLDYLDLGWKAIVKAV